MDAKTEAFDPAAHGWETYADEGFIGYVGPFWMKKDGDGYRYAIVAQKKLHTTRRRAGRHDHEPSQIVRSA